MSSDPVNHDSSRLDLVNLKQAVVKNNEDFIYSAGILSKFGDLQIHSNDGFCVEINLSLFVIWSRDYSDLFRDALESGADPLAIWTDLSKDQLSVVLEFLFTGTLKVTY